MMLGSRRPGVDALAWGELTCVARDSDSYGACGGIRTFAKATMAANAPIAIAHRSVHVVPPPASLCGIALTLTVGRLGR